MADLRTRNLGLELRSPLVASPSPLTGSLEGLKRLEAAGVGAPVLPSLFEEQLTHDQLELDRLLETTADHTGEARSYFPDLQDYNSEELRLPLRWIAILFGRVGASLAATTGVHTGLDAAKVLLAGADVAMLASALLGHGPEHIAVVEGSSGPSWPTTTTTRSASSGAA